MASPVAQRLLNKDKKKKKVFDSADEADSNLLGSTLGHGGEPKPWWDIFGFACCAGDRSGDMDEDDAKQVKETPISPMKSPSKLSSVTVNPVKSDAGGEEAGSKTVVDAEESKEDEVDEGKQPSDDGKNADDEGKNADAAEEEEDAAEEEEVVEEKGGEAEEEADEKTGEE